MAAIDRWLEYAAFGIEVLAVVLIARHVLAGTARLSAARLGIRRRGAWPG
jgi:hypothetical protein